MGRNFKNAFWVALGVITAWAISIRPRTKGKPDLSVFSAYDYANGGLHDYCKNFPENSLDAFEAAYSHGYGIAIPVRITKDGVPVAFSDHELWRMCNSEGVIEEMTLEQLKQLKLLGTKHQIPTLENTLSMIDGRVPVLMQLKVQDNNYNHLSESVAAVADNYKGVFAVESMDYRCVRWFMRNRPAVIRGQMFERSVDFGDSVITFLRQFAKNWLLTNNMCRPDFIAAHVVDRNSISLRFCKLLYHIPVIHWTVCTLKGYEKSRIEDAVVVFEDIEP